MAKLSLYLDEKATARVEELSKKIGGNGELKDLKQAMSLAQVLLQMDRSDRPGHVQVSGLVITNEAYRWKEHESFRAEMAKLAPQEASVAKTLYESAQLKPSLFGVGADLKPIIDRLQRWFKAKRS